MHLHYTIIMHGFRVIDENEPTLAAALVLTSNHSQTLGEPLIIS